MNQHRSASEAQGTSPCRIDTTPAQMALEVLRLETMACGGFPQLKDAAERALLRYFKATEASGDA